MDSQLPKIKVLFYPLLVLLVFFKLQLSEFPGEVYTEGPERDLSKAVERKIATLYRSFLVDILADRIRDRESYAALFVPKLFPHRDAIGREGRVSPLDLIAGRAEIAEELRDKGRAELVGSVEVDAIVEAVDGRPAE